MSNPDPNAPQNGPPNTPPNAPQSPGPLNVAGPWASVGIAFLVFLFSSFLTGLAMVLTGAISAKEFEDLGTAIQNDPQKMQSLFMRMAALNAAIGTALIWLFAQRISNGRAEEYLAIRPVSKAMVARWVGITGLFLVGMYIVLGLLTALFNYQPPPPVYENMSASVMTVIAIVIAAPFFEEVLFRGFLFEGLIRSRLSWRGTIIVTTLLWAIMHVQYDVVGQMIIFGMGVLLGFARLYSGSVILPIILHIAFNGVQVMLQVMLYGELSL